MKRFLVIALLGWNSLAMAQATAHFTASVTIIEPVAISTTSDMNFSRVDARSGGAVVLTPESSRIAVGDVDLKDGGVVSAASFAVTGEKGLTVALTIPNENYSLSNGNENIVIKDFTSNLPETFQLAENSVSLNVGATLEIKPRQVPGFYSSKTPMKVTVNYN